MSRIFLGRWWHWAILAAIVGALWFAGEKRMHVVYFNDFILLLLASITVVLAVLLAGTRPGEQVTRDRLEHPPEAPHPEEHAKQPGRGT